MNVQDSEAATAIRISCGWDTDSDDIERLIAAWRDLYIRVTHSDMTRARAA
jgi:cysteine desulfurase